MALSQQDQSSLDAIEQLDDEAQLAIDAATFGVKAEFARRGFRHGDAGLDEVKAAIFRYFVTSQGAA
ncbi:hypothetical protein P0D88_34930 [Paraburkholderia sp. RL18-103-BIB-C]|uniref:hypothetical protein n=1 Tax=Paraburkholderia sp. RL18-103-BIB-C TaxID=3031637 RepID=UPI0038B99EB2